MKKSLQILLMICTINSIYAQNLDSNKNISELLSSYSQPDIKGVIRTALVKGDSTINNFEYDPLKVVDAIVIFTENPLSLKLLENGNNREKYNGNLKIQSSISELFLQHSQFKSDLLRIEKDVESILNKNNNSALGVTKLVMEFHKSINGIAIKGTNAVLNELRKLPYVKGIYPDYPVTINYLNKNNDVELENSELKNNYTGKNIVIGIIDTGVDYLRNDLGGGIGAGYKVIGGYDFVNKDDNPMDDHGHGTAVAGVAAANSILYKGIAKDAKIYALKALNSFGSGSVTHIIAAIEKAMDPNNDNSFDDKVNILNLSLGSTYGGSSDPLAIAINNATNTGIVCVVAAGNDGGILGYHSAGSPASSEKAICVGAVDANDNIASFSSKGPARAGLFIKPEVVAPGSGINAPMLGGGYALFSGTSLAAPYVAGYAALLLEQHPQANPEIVKSLVTQNAKKVSGDYFSYGFGVADVSKVLCKGTVTPAIINLGVIEPGSNSYSVSKEYTVYNFASTSENFIINLPSINGITILINPQNFTVEPNSSKKVEITYNISLNSLANSDVLKKDWLPYSGEIQFQSESNQYRSLFSFVISNYIRLNIKEFSNTIIHNRINAYWTNAGLGENNYGDLNTFLLPTGTYDVVNNFIGFASGKAFTSYVILEGIELTKSVTKTVTLLDATNTCQYNWRDQTGAQMNFQPFTGFSILEHKSSKYGIQISTNILSVGISNLSDKYRYEQYYISNPNLKPFYFFKAIQNNGINTNYVFPSNNIVFNDIQFKYRVPANIENIWLLAFNGFYNFGSASSSFSLQEKQLAKPFENQAYIMAHPCEEYFKYRFIGSNPEQPYLHVLLPDQAGTTDFFKSRLLYITPWHKIDAVGKVSTYFYNDNSRPVLTNYHKKITYGLGPTHWYGKFENNSSQIKFKTNSFLGTLMDHYPGGVKSVFYPLFLNQYQDASPKSELTYRLINAQNQLADEKILNQNILTETKSIGVNSFYDYKIGIPITQGIYSIEISDNNSLVNGIAGKSKIIATMDTRLQDKNPPSMISFNVLTDNEYSDVLANDQVGQIQFSVEDQESNLTTQLFYRNLDGTTWNKMDVTNKNNLFVSDITSTIPKGYISIKVLVIDGANNQLEYSAEPAFYNMATSVKPENIILDSPLNKMVIHENTVVLKWNQTDLVEKYHLQLSSDSLFNSNIMDDHFLAATERNITSLENDKTYFWRVRGVNTYGSGGWSEVRSFKTLIIAPEKPVLLYPGNLLADMSKSVTLKWKKTTGAIGYTFEMAHDTAFTVIVNCDSSITDTFKLISNLVEGKKYFWHVRAKNTAGVSLWSDPWSFSTQINKPDNLEITRSGLQEVKLTWKDNSTGETGYIIERKQSATVHFIVLDSVKTNAVLFFDKKVEQGLKYIYRLKGYTDDFESDYSNEASIIVVGVEEKEMPKEYSLMQNYPNPFNPITTIKYTVPKTSFVHLSIYDILGREVSVLVDEEKNPGYYEVKFEINNLASGIYYYKIRSGDFIQTRKMLLLK